MGSCAKEAGVDELALARRQVLPLQRLLHLIMMMRVMMITIARKQVAPPPPGGSRPPSRRSQNSSWPRLLPPSSDPKVDFSRRRTEHKAGQPPQIARQSSNKPQLAHLMTIKCCRTTRRFEFSPAVFRTTILRLAFKSASHSPSNWSSRVL